MSTGVPILPGATAQITGRPQTVVENNTSTDGPRDANQEDAVEVTDALT